MKKVIIVIVFCLLLCGCNNKQNESSDNMTYDLKEILKENNYVIVDVRTKEEYEEGHVKDSLNIPYDEIDENTKLDKSKTILVYCKSGRRSGIAKDTLDKLGYNVINIGAYDSLELEKE